MKIIKDVLEGIISCSSVPPETGGIIGGRDGVVTEFIFDAGSVDTTRAMYIPNINKLNQCIDEWNENRIVWMGIVHTHLPDQEKLSSADLEYIRTILSSLPSSRQAMYFPIVIPHVKMIPYYAYISKDLNVQVIRDSISVIDGER